eukprot:gi/632935551/ref/XP_007890456.1/ PREDICTED: protein FAM162A-like isoform X1 [Callorhinchus milii]
MTSEAKTHFAVQLQLFILFRVGGVGWDFTAKIYIYISSLFFCLFLLVGQSKQRGKEPHAMLRGLLRAGRLLAVGVAGRPGVGLPERVTGAQRRFCNKAAQDAVRGTGAPLQSGGAAEAFPITNLQSRIPSAFDMKVLLWSGRFKKKEDIPQMVSMDMLAAAANNLRVKICYLMIALSVVGCFVMVISGKNAVKRDESLTKSNLDKKAKLKEEYQKEQELIARKAE